MRSVIKPFGVFLGGVLLEFHSIVFFSMLEIIFFLAHISYLLLDIKGSSKLTYLVANTGGPVTGHCQIADQTKFHMVKGFDNAFDHIELCFAI